MDTGDYIEVYEYKYRRIPLIAPWTATQILNEKPGELIKLEGRGSIYIEKGNDAYQLIYDENKIIIHKNFLYKISRSRKFYIINGESLRPLEIRTSSYYKLLPLDSNRYPTLEINGIHMHRILGIDPWTDTLLKVKAARVGRGHRVLDTCTGLGYTAIASIKRGATEVITIEIDENVLLIASYNPWSSMLENDKIIILHGDATKIIKKLKDNYFDRIIHDPPRFSSKTGDLYGRDFYKELYRVLKPGGLLFHYTGEPGRLRRRSLPERTVSMLEKVGFVWARYIDKAKGVVAVKPR